VGAFGRRTQSGSTPQAEAVELLAEACKLEHRADRFATSRLLSQAKSTNHIERCCTAELDLPHDLNVLGTDWLLALRADEERLSQLTAGAVADPHCRAIWVAVMDIGPAKESEDRWI